MPLGVDLWHHQVFTGNRLLITNGLWAYVWVIPLQWRTQDLEKEGARPPLLVKGGGEHHIFGLNWGLKGTNKPLTTGQKERARPPVPPLNPPLQWQRHKPTSALVKDKKEVCSLYIYDLFL